MTDPQQLPGAGKRILVVDDERLVRRVVALMLRSQGYDVDEAGSAAEAVDKYQAQQTNGGYVAVITDVQMPVEDGFSLGHKLRALSPEQPLVFISGSTTSPHAFQDKHSLQLFKPLETEQLADALHSLLSS